MADKTIENLYEDYFTADSAWWLELVARFGDDACQARYEKRGRGSFGDELGRTYLAMHKAQMLYFEAYRNSLAA